MLPGFLVLKENLQIVIVSVLLCYSLSGPASITGH